MPTYEYACKACDHNFEIVQSFREDTLTTCPECEQDELRKVYNAAGIIFKGDGWHIKDYGGSKSSTSTTTTASSDSSSSDSGKGSSDSSASAKKDSSSSTSSSGEGSTKAAS